MPRKAMRIVTEKSTDDLESAPGEFEVPVPLALDNWDLADAIGAYGPARPVIVESADGDLFTATVLSVSAQAHALTVELT